MIIKKAYFYPVVVLLAVGLLVFLLVSVVYKMGLQVNPPQPNFAIEKNIKPYIIWTKGKTWMASKTGSFSIFDTSVTDVKEEFLSVLLKNDNPEVVLLNVKADIGKEEVISLLENLAQFSLKRVYVTSAYDNSLENLRKAEARFLFAPSPKTWIKWSLLSSFYIHTIFDPKSDFFFIDEKVKELLAPKLKAEIQRRNMPEIRTSKGNTAISL